MPGGSAAIYCRISRDRVGAGLGVQRQEQDCRALADQRGLEVVDVYLDNDISAYSGKRRPDYERLLLDIQARHVTAVIAWHADRLHRSPVELERYIQICDPLGVPTYTVKAGELDLSTASGRMVARITGAVARHESEQKGERVRSQKLKAQANGLWLGGRRPFGYAPDGRTVRPTVGQLAEMFQRAKELYGRPMPSEGELVQLAAQYTAEADAVADATRRVLAGESVRAIFNEWNARGMTTATGKRWTGSQIRQVLLRPRNAGLTGNAKGGRPHIIGDATWTALVDRDQWEALRATLTDPSRISNHGNVSRKLLGSYLYYCGECGQRVTSGGTRTADGAGRYACREQHLARIAGPIDRMVIKVVEGVLRKSNISLRPPGPDVAPLREKVDALRVREKEIAALFGDPTSGMTAVQFRVSNDRIQAQLRDLEAQIGRLTAGDTLAGIIDAPDPVVAFRDAGIDRQRAVIDVLMTVTIKKARHGRGPNGSYFDPESVEIVPKPVDPIEPISDN